MIISGRWIDQLRSRRINMTDPGCRQHQQAEVMISRSLWKEERLTSILEETGMNWIRNVGVKTWDMLQEMQLKNKMIATNNRQHANGERFSTDLQLLMTETTINPVWLGTLVCMKRQQRDMIPEEYQTHRRYCQAGWASSSLKTRS